VASTKTFIVTGGNTGLEFECASALSGDIGSLVIIACRDVQKGEQDARRMRGANGNAKVLPLDLSRRVSIRSLRRSEGANFLR
jgi:NAD(P)-dependent dehydrogenase (short-subunit alcohol dehydrogenase family)